MADVRSVDVRGDEIFVNLKITSSEYRILRSSTKNLVVLPTDSSILADVLTTGTLGNGNRIMIPNKLLKRCDISVLNKKVPSKIFRVNNEDYLLIKLDGGDLGIPSFESREDD